MAWCLAAWVRPGIPGKGRSSALPAALSKRWSQGQSVRQKGAAAPAATAPT